MSDSESRFTLVAGEGDGAMLGMAAGDTAGGIWELGYSAITEQATIVSYQLIEHGRIDPDSLVGALREMDGSNAEEPVFRSETPEFRVWLDHAARGGTTPDAVSSIDAAARSVPLGVMFRREPETLRVEALSLGRLFHTETSSILIGMATAGAVAASCFGQSGRDLISGVVEIVEPLVDALAEGPDVSELIGELGALSAHVGVSDGHEALALASNGRSPGQWDRFKAGLLLAAPLVERAHVPIEQAARIGGSPLGAAVGGIVGARVGIKAWPWAFANDTWFAEIGRRLARGPRDVTDLPIPYAVEQHLMSGERQGLH